MSLFGLFGSGSAALDLASNRSANQGSERDRYAVPRSLYRLLGPNVTAMMIASIPVGITLGIVEIVTASVLYAVLATFHLVAATPVSSAITFGLEPVTALFIFTILAALLRYASQTLPALSDYALTMRLREALVRSTLGGVTERSVMSVAETSHLVANVVPRGGECANGMSAVAAAVCLLGLVLIGLIRTSWQLAIIALGFGASLAVLLVTLRKSYGKYVALIYPFFQKFNNAMIRAARNNHFLRVHGANQREAEMLIEMSRNNLVAAKNYTLLFGLSCNIPAPAAVFVVVGVFWLNARFGFLPVEGLVPLVYLLSRTGSGVAEIAMAVGRVQRNWPYLKDLLAHTRDLFPENEPPITSTDVPQRFLPLDVKSLRFGRTAALTCPVNLSACGGDVVLISGSSGRGKTTLVMTLIGLIHPIGGAIYWGGMPIDRIDAKRLRRVLGYAGPEPYLIDSDIRTNLLFGIEPGSVTDADIVRALRLAKADFVFDLQGGLGHHLRESGDGISAGQKQRLALARCLLRRPEILLLDEATSNIDEDTEKQIMDGLRATFPDLLIIAVSHRTSLRRYATVQVEL